MKFYLSVKYHYW